MTVDSKEVLSDPIEKEIKFILELFHSNKLSEANKEIDKQLIKYPKSSILFNILGAVLSEQNKFTDAVENYKKAIKINSNYFKAYNNLGACFYKFGKISDAIQNYKKAIEIEPNLAGAHNNLGVAFKELGEQEKSKAYYQKAIEIEPNHADAHNNLGVVFKELGEQEHSMACYQTAIEIEPNHADAHNNLGAEFKELKDYKKSIYHYEKNISIKPKSPIAYSNLGNVYKALGEYEKAVSWHQKAIQINPQYSDAYYNLGQLFEKFNEFDKAANSYQKAIEFQPDHSDANTNFLFNACWSNEDIDYLKFAKKYYKSIKKYEDEELETIKNTSEKILKIGFISGDFRNHSVAFFLLNTLENLKKKEVKLFAYSNNAAEDKVTKFIQQFFDKWTSVVHKTDKDLINLIRKDNIDILFDLSGHTGNNRLAVFKNRCAPTQVSWCGWLASTGVKEIDYIIGDQYATPLKDQSKFTEKIYQLKKIWQCFSILDLNSQSLNIKENNKENIIFGSFVNNAKISENVIKTWSKILNKVPDSKLFLKCTSFDNLTAKNNFLKRLNNKISEDRLIIEGKSSKSDYLNSYNKIDIALDTFPTNGATTSFEASYMGVPILTKVIEGNFWFRCGESINKNLGMNDWIAKNEEDYIEKAVKFSSNKKNLILMKPELRNSALKSPLFDSTNFSEDFYEMLVDIKA